ncbi:MAG: hypothetical protein N2249_01680 [Melioribacter sp.]|nr:hypothetical protein [Melioribacter sp.]
MRKIILLIIIFYTQTFAQHDKLTGFLILDSKISFNNTKTNFIENSQVENNKKSPILAAALSFALPGTGQFYSESYLKTIIYLAVEVTAITIGTIYDKKGDKQTDFFQNFADKHWDVKRYALWTIKNASKINPEINPNNFKVFNLDGTVNWRELNRLESAIGGYYSHHLAPYGDQQYYEMIGKYPQFNVGWDDFGDENTPFNYGDPLTPNFIYYSHERGKANDFYSVAHTAVLIIVTNHILSAIDAAWTASRFNKKLTLSAELKSYEFGYKTLYYPQLNLQYNF